jgi:hypothetical protein
MAPISNELFQNSLRHVRRELKTLGFDKKGMLETKVSRTLIPSLRRQAYFHKGEIFIPILQSRKNVRDMLRHEYGHALLYYFPEIMATKGFRNFCNSSDINDYVSRYAMTNPDEDFCETLMKYMKHGGKFPRKNVSPELMKKWRFISGLRRKRTCSS